MSHVSAKSIKTSAHILGGLTIGGAMAVALVWALGLMTFGERAFMTTTILMNALLVWVLAVWAKQMERDERFGSAHKSE